MAKRKKKEIVKEIIEEPVIEDEVVKIEIISIKNPCPKCGTEMVQHGGGPKGYSDFKCPACGAGLSKVI